MLCCTMLSGCAGNATEAGTSSENTAAFTEAPADETVSPTEEPAERDADPKAELLRMRAEDPDLTIHFSFRAEGDVIGVYHDNDMIGEIIPDTVPDDDTVIWGMDCDFDNIDDVYISGEARPVRLTPGDYWLCDPETLEFRKSAELGFYYGRGLFSNVNGRTLEVKYEEPAGNSQKCECTLILAWDADRLVPLALKKKRTLYKRDTDNGIRDMYYEDCYEFDENGDQLLLRHSVLDDKGEKIVDSSEDALNIRVTDEAVECMKGTELIQTIPVENLRETAAALNGMPVGEPVMKPLAYAGTVLQEDYDFDGYEDLRITTGTDEAGVADSFAYYRFDPSAGTYQEWPELNALPAVPLVYRGSEELVVEIPEYDENLFTSHTYSYEWDNGKLRPTEHHESRAIFSESNGIYHTMNYFWRYDENGTEYLAGSYEVPKTVGG